MADPKDTATYLCPPCRQRVRVFVREGGWYWANHRTRTGRDWCANSGKRVAP